jgi:hypothetical protein
MMTASCCAAGCFGDAANGTWSQHGAYMLAPGCTDAYVSICL